MMESGPGPARQAQTRGYPIAAVAGIMLILLCEYFGLFEGANSHLYDVFTRLRNVRHTSGNILIVAIDEKTLEAFGRWPISRSHYAALLDKLKYASAVGFDIFMAEPSADDKLLGEAVSRHGRVVMPAYIDDEEKIVDPVPMLSPRTIAHVHAEQGVDSTIREIYHTLYFRERMLPSLDSALYELGSGRPFPRTGLPADNSAQDRAGAIYQTDLMRINFYGPPGTFPRISLADTVKGKFTDDLFRDKIVLVGLTAPGIADRVQTPLNQYRGGMSGVELHANVLNNIVDGRSIRTIGKRMLWAGAFALAAVFFLISLKVNEKVAALICVAGILLLTVISFSLFLSLDLWVRPVLFYAVTVFVFAAAYIVKLDDAVKKLDRKYADLNKQLGGGEKTPEAPETGLVTILSSRGINSKIEELLRVQRLYEFTLEDTVRRRTRALTEALAMINEMDNEMIFRLARAAESKDVDTGEHVNRVGLYAKIISLELGMSEEFAEMIKIAGTLHDIGKIGIPDRILLKQGKLTDGEKAIVNTHTVLGNKILAGSEYPKIRMSASIALNHHERWDGTGYPRGIKGGDIPVEAGIIKICDEYDALRSRRPYKQPISHDITVRIISEGDDRTRPEHFSPAVLTAFLKVASEFERIFDEHRL